jgi:hypothetical protein
VLKRDSTRVMPGFWEDCGRYAPMLSVHEGDDITKKLSTLYMLLICIASKEFIKK